MKANWEDAPLRISRRKNHKPLIIALIIVIGVAATALIAKTATPTMAKPEQIQIPAISTTDIKQTAEAAKDIYLEQVNNMLTSSTEWALCEAYKDNDTGLGKAMRKHNCKPNPVAEIEWIDTEQATSAERQTVFNDANYTPPATVNTVRMPQPKPEPMQPQQRTQPYVTVVKETRESCGFHKPGSLECRRARAQIYKSYSKACLQSRDSQSSICRLAKAYEPRR